MQNALQQISGQVVARRVSEQVAEELTDVTLNSGEMRLIPFRNAETRATFNDDVAERAASLWENNPVNVEYALAAPNTDTDDEPSGQSGFAQSVPGDGQHVRHV